jgi:hypothetical protein
MNSPLYGFTLTGQISPGTPLTVDDAVAAGPRMPLGAKITWKGNVYRYVKFDNGTGNVAAVKGGPAYWKTLTPTATTPVWTVTSDASDGAYLAQGVAGIFVNVPTDLNFCFIQVAGVASIYAGATNAAGAMYFGTSVGDNALIYVAYGATGPLQTLPYGAPLIAIQTGATAGDGTGLATALLSGPMNW